MKVVMKKLGIMLTLIVACFALPACDNDNDDNDGDRTPVSNVSSQIVKNWQMVNIFSVTVDDKGNAQKEEGHMMQSALWEFRNDGYQYIVLDGIPAVERYAYTVKGNKITLTQDVQDNPEIITGTAAISNGTMILDLYVYGEDNKNEYMEYIFQQVN